jgi:hypothetical protein
MVGQSSNIYNKGFNNKEVTEPRVYIMFSFDEGCCRKLLNQGLLS